jgi:hypothetical protein
MWVRSFDDASTGREKEFDDERLPGYPAAGSVPFLRAARFAVNKGLHVLSEFTEVAMRPGFAGYGIRPWGGGVQRPEFRWRADVPLVRGDSGLRDAFVDVWAGRLVLETLAEVHAWIHGGYAGG